MNKKQFIQKIKDRYQDSKALKQYAPEITVSSYLDGMMSAFMSMLMHANDLEEFPISLLYAELGELQDELLENDEMGEWNGVKMAMIRIGEFVRKWEENREQSTTHTTD